MDVPARTAEPNVTPLIDVMLVLLILFMVVTPVAQRGLDVALPQSHARGDSCCGPAAPVVAVGTEDVELDGHPLPTLSDLETELRDVLATRSERTVFVRAKEDVPYGRAVAAMDAARAAGADRIGLLSAAGLTAARPSTRSGPGPP
jgi:biopolymer transport protein ExbD